MKIENRRLYVPVAPFTLAFECSHGHSCESYSRNKNKMDHRLFIIYGWTERGICFNLERPCNGAGGGRNRWCTHLDSLGSMESLYLITIGFPAM